MPRCPKCEEEFTRQEFEEFQPEYEFKKDLERSPSYQQTLSAKRKIVIFWSVLALCGVLVFVWFISSLYHEDLSGFWGFVFTLLVVLAFVFWVTIVIISYQNAEVKVIDSFRTR